MFLLYYLKKTILETQICLESFPYKSQPELKTLEWNIQIYRRIINLKIKVMNFPSNI